MTTKATKGLMAQIESILNAEIPGTPRLHLRRLAKQINEVLQTEIPGTPKARDIAKQIMALVESEAPPVGAIGRVEPPKRASMVHSTIGRVQYVTIRSVRDLPLSARAMQLARALDKHGGKGTSADLQRWLKVNRNVIAGALHELRRNKVIRSKPLE